MPRRSWATSSASSADTASSSCRTRLRRMAYCSSSSVGMRGLVVCAGNEAIGTSRLLEENVERRHVVVPLDQGRERTEPGQRVPVERPHLLDDARAVIVDAQD